MTHGSADTRSDADLLAAHAAGDPDAFGEVVRRHRDRLWAVALRTLGDREEAADAVQDALVSALRASGPRADPSADAPSGPGFRGESAVTTWLHRIVVNACLDRVRRKASRPADPLPDYDVPDRAPRPAGRARARARPGRRPGDAAGRPARRPRPRRHVRLPRRRGRDDPRLRRGHREEPLRARPGTPCPAPAARPDRPSRSGRTPPIRSASRGTRSTWRASHQSTTSPPHPPKEVTRTDEHAHVPPRRRPAGRPPRRSARSGAGHHSGRAPGRLRRVPRTKRTRSTTYERLLRGCWCGRGRRRTRRRRTPS